MNQLDAKTRKLIIQCLMEGQSIRATARTTQTSKNTVTKLLIDAGKAAASYQDKVLRCLPCKRVEVNEIWSFLSNKQRTIGNADAAAGGLEDVWTWTAICTETMLVPSWCVGDRSGLTAISFLDDLRSRLTASTQLADEGHKPCLQAVADAFDGDNDYKLLVKLYGNTPAEGTRGRNATFDVSPDPKHISATHIEWDNPTIRMSVRRFSLLTNAFVKKVQNHFHSVALHFMYYNFCLQHKSLKDNTPALAAGVTDRLWDLEDMFGVLDDAATVSK